MYALLLPDNTLPDSLGDLKRELTRLGVESEAVTAQVRSLTPIVQNSALAAQLNVSLADHTNAVVIAVGNAADAAWPSGDGRRTLLIDPPISEVSASVTGGKMLGRPGEESRPTPDARENVMAMLEEGAREARESGDPHLIRHAEEVIASTVQRFPLEGTSQVTRVPTLRWAADFAENKPQLTIWSTRIVPDHVAKALGEWPIDRVVHKSWSAHWWWADPHRAAREIRDWMGPSHSGVS